LCRYTASSEHYGNSILPKRFRAVDTGTESDSVGVVANALVQDLLGSGAGSLGSVSLCCGRAQASGRYSALTLSRVEARSGGV
jgi:hypothetical protein